jgi:hypothetical protein
MAMTGAPNIARRLTEAHPPELQPSFLSQPDAARKLRVEQRARRDAMSERPSADAPELVSSERAIGERAGVHQCSLST